LTFCDLMHERVSPLPSQCELRDESFVTKRFAYGVTASLIFLLVDPCSLSEAHSVQD